MLEVKVKDLDQLVAEVDYAFLNEHYIPSTNAVEFITFIKLVNGGEGEERSGAESAGQGAERDELSEALEPNPSLRLVDVWGQYLRQRPSPQWA